jgi:hypothetical protein
MSRSRYQKNWPRGISEKWDKTHANRKFRHRIRQTLHEGCDEEDLPVRKQAISDVWGWKTG